MDFLCPSCELLEDERADRGEKGHAKHGKHGLHLGFRWIPDGAASGDG